MSSSAVVFAGIAPHPPIMIPEVGGAAASEVRGSIDAMRELTARILANQAETIVLISPHAPLEARAFVAYTDAQLRGDFASFRAPHATVEANLDVALLEAISRTALQDNYPVVYLKEAPLDHGIAVPLYFLQRNGWQGDIVALGYSGLSNEDHLRFGSCIRRAADAIGREIAFVASGDLSHRLKLDAPAGYEPEAHLFDAEVVESLRACAPERIVQINPHLRRTAGECGYRSMLVACGVVEGLTPVCEVLHYEAPFGVGYLVAQLTIAPDPARTNQHELTEPARETQPIQSMAPTEHPPADLSTDEEILPALARQAIETFVREHRLIDPPADLGSPLLTEEAACFVSIKTDHDELRGCIGTIKPTQPTLAEELITNAINAAMCDPRFPPITPSELPHLRYSVDVLSTPEPTRFEELNPSIFGVIVEDHTSGRHGLLLPNIKGVETPVEQVEIAARKAGLEPGDSSLKLYRFRVRRFRDQEHLYQTSE